MTNARARLSVMLGLTLLFGLAGAGWAAPCGDSTGPGGTLVPCNCGDSPTTDTKLRPAQDPVCFDPLDTQPGDLPCPGDGLIMNTSGVTLNLDACHIKGSLAPGSAGIRISSGVNNLEIRNAGPITDFEFGIFSDNTTNGTTIRNTRIRENSANGIDVIGDNNEIIANRVGQNGGYGIICSGDNNLLSKNQARENGSGIVCVGTGNQIGDNVARDNDEDGICVSGVGNIDAGGNIAKGNTPTVCTFQCEIDGVQCK